MAVKKMLLVIVAAALMVSVALPGVSIAGAAVPDTLDKPKGDPIRKLGRGISNCLTFPIEILNQIAKTNNNDGPVAAITYGAVKGIVMGIFRAVIGGYEVITFPLPFPEWYRPILTDPEFMLESWSI